MAAGVARTREASRMRAERVCRFEMPWPGSGGLVCIRRRVSDHASMEFVLQDAERLLARTPPLLDGWLRGLPDAWMDAREGPGSWSPREVIGHLIHGEDTDWIPRARIILEHGAARAFEPFDRLAQLRRFAGVPVDRLLDEF